MSPRTLSAEPVAQIKARSGERLAPVHLVDITTYDGSQYFWTDFAGNYPRAADSVQQTYAPWLKSAGPFRRSRDSRTDAGDLVVQNLSGNTLDRDVASAMKAHEFEGALCVARVIEPLTGLVLEEFHGYLSEQNPSDEEVVFRLLQLFDVAQFDVADEPYSETCTLRFKSAQCGSASANATCSKKFADCTAQERFNGCPTPPPQTTAASHLDDGGSSSVGSGGSGGGMPHRPDSMSPL